MSANGGLVRASSGSRRKSLEAQRRGSLKASRRGSIDRMGSSDRRGSLDRRPSNAHLSEGFNSTLYAGALERLEDSAASNAGGNETEKPNSSNNGNKTAITPSKKVTLKNPTRPSAAKSRVNDMSVKQHSRAFMVMKSLRSVVGLVKGQGRQDSGDKNNTTDGVGKSTHDQKDDSGKATPRRASLTETAEMLGAIAMASTNSDDLSTSPGSSKSRRRSSSLGSPNLIDAFQEHRLNHAMIRHRDRTLLNPGSFKAGKLSNEQATRLVNMKAFSPTIPKGDMDRRARKSSAYLHSEFASMAAAQSEYATAKEDKEDPALEASFEGMESDEEIENKANENRTSETEPTLLGLKACVLDKNICTELREALRAALIERNDIRLSARTHMNRQRSKARDQLRNIEPTVVFTHMITMDNITPTQARILRRRQRRAERNAKREFKRHRKTAGANDMSDDDYSREHLDRFDALDDESSFSSGAARLFSRTKSKARAITSSSTVNLLGEQPSDYAQNVNTTPVSIARSASKQIFKSKVGDHNETSLNVLLSHHNTPQEGSNSKR